MARLSRKNLKLFASTSGSNGQFGSAALGTKVITSDVETIQALGAWLTGWFTAVIGTKKFPALEEFQAVAYVMCYQLAYMLQQGVPEWYASTTYYQNSIVVKPGTFEAYGSKVDNNTGNALPNQVDDANWYYLQNLKAGTVPNATTAVRGIAMLATQADVVANNTDKIVTPDLLKSNGFETGDWKGRTLTALPANGGWIWGDGKTVGNAASNATNRANADTLELFSAYWNDAAYNYAGTTATGNQLQVYNSSGVAVAKGANAAADYAANRSIAIVDFRGRVPAGKDNMGGTAAGRLSGQPFGVNGQLLGGSGGQELHQLIIAELAAHTHAVTSLVTDSAGVHTHTIVRARQNTVSPQAGFNYIDAQVVTSTTSQLAPETVPPYPTPPIQNVNPMNTAGAHTHTISGSIDNTGGDSPHNNVQPTMICNIIIKL